MIKAEFV